MIDFFGGQLDYVFFFHGLALVLMAGIARALSWRPWTTIPWKWYAVFALAAALAQWAEVFEVALGLPVLDVVVGVPATVLAAAALIEGCRRTSSGWLRRYSHAWTLLATALVGIAMASGDRVAADVARRYLLLLPAAAWAAWMFWRAARVETGAGVGVLRLTAFAFAVVAVVSGIVVRPAGLVPIYDRAAVTATQATGATIELIRALAGVLLAVSVWHHYCQIQRADERRVGASGWNRYEAILTTVLTAVLAGGWFVTEWATRVELEEARAHLATRAETSAAMLPPGLVTTLVGDPADVEAGADARTMLQAICATRPDVNGVALVARTGGSHVYLVDVVSERWRRTGVRPAGAGTPYRGAGERPTAADLERGSGEDWRRVRDVGSMMIATVPVAPLDGRATGLLEVTFDAAQPWHLAARVRLFPISVTLLTGTLFLAFFMSERRTSESGLRIAASEQRYRGLVEGSPDGVMLLDREARVLAINQNGRTVFSLDEEAIIGRLLPELWPDTERHPIASAAEQAASGERVRIEIGYRSPAGSPIDLELVLNPVTGGGPSARPSPAAAVTHLVGIASDVTARRRAQASLQRSHQFTHVILGISARFLGLRTERVDSAVREALREVGGFLDVNRAQLFHLLPDRDRFSLTHEWCGAGVPSLLPVLQNVEVADYPWTWRTLETAGIVLIGDVDQMPDEAAAERDRLKAHGIASLVCIPVHRRGTLTGLLALDVFERTRDWPDSEVALLRIVADVLSNGLSRKLSDEALRDSEQRFQQAFRNNPAAMAIFWTENQRIVEVNQAWLDLIDRPALEVIGRTVDEIGLMVEDGGERFGRSLAAVEGVRSLEMPIRTGIGETRHVSLSTDAFELAGQRFMLAVALDMSARVRAEAALREREEIFRSISAAAQDAIIMIDPDARVTVWNQAAERVFGYPREEAEGRPLATLIVPEESEAGFMEAFGQFRGTGEGDFVNSAQQVFGRRKDGSRVPVELTASSVQLRGRWHSVGILRDITERLKVEEALWKAKEETDVANAELQRSVERANRLAEEAALANASKSDFLANMSHEIRTPMNGIIGMTGLLLDTTLTDDQHEYADTVRTCADSLLTIINEILDFSKIEAGKLDLETLEFDLAATLEDTLDMLAVRAQQKGLEMASLVAPDVPLGLRGDPGRLRQILTNLLGNAIKFTERGEVTLSVTFEGDDAAGALLRFEVRDTGIGVPDEKLGKLFQPFSQVDSSHTRRFGGTGLGLSISRRLAEMMGGTIGVESEVGVGSAFWFTARFGRAPAAAASPHLGDLTGVRVLGQDDNQTNRRVLGGMLEAWGCRHEEVGWGADVLEALTLAVEAGDPFRIAILDMKAPDMSGDELGMRIKADPVIADTAIVIMTSVARRGEASRLQAAGFSGYLTKPIKASQLRHLLATLTRPPAAGDDGQAAGSQPVEAPPRRKARLLLAEDNMTNQKVAIKVLERMGHRVDAVANGAEAVRVLQGVPYDLVFMDVQMPEMDGFEATRLIRDPQSGALNPSIPIVAMTAHAMKGDRERCLEAGMDDYVAKPISPKAVADALSRWLKPEEFDTTAAVAATSTDPGAGARPAAAREAVPVAAAASASPGSASAADGEMLPTRDSLMERLGGDEEVFVEVIKIFLADSPQLLTGMDESLASGDVKTLRRLAHTMKGSAGTAGAEALQQASFRLEQAATAGDLEAAASLIPPVKRLFQVVLDTMTPWVAGATP